MEITTQLVIIHFEDWEWWFVDGVRKYSGRIMDVGMTLTFVSKLPQFNFYRYFSHDIFEKRRRAEDVAHAEPETLREFLSLLDPTEFNKIYPRLGLLLLDGNE